MAKVLLTGGSSFTGLWIAEALAAEGFEVTAAITRPLDGYSGLRADRVARLEKISRVIPEAPVASERFLAAAREGADLLAHHGADIPGYRDRDYDLWAGYQRNMAGVRDAIAAFAKAGGRGFIATGTYFEDGEGGGETAASPYGASKALTNAEQARLAAEASLSFGKFVVPSPFGRWEEGRIVWSLFQAWSEGRPAEIRTPAYVRDQLPVPLLADAYVSAARAVLAWPQPARFRPSGYVETVGAFAGRVANHVRARTGWACELILHEQTTFQEPPERANDQPMVLTDEAAFWDDYVAYYDKVRARGLLAGSGA
jgi:UDP-glucose 4-epimerase